MNKKIQLSISVRTCYLSHKRHLRGRILDQTEIIIQKKIRNVK